MTNGTDPWSFITTQNTWFNYDYDKRNISMIIIYHTEYLVQLWLLQTKYIHDHSLPHIILGSTMTTTNGTYPWAFITTHNTSFNHDYDKRNISMIIHYHTEYLVHLWLRQTEHIHDHSLPHRILGSTMTTTNETYPWSFITTHNTWFNHNYDKRNISMIIHYHTEYLVQLWLRQTKHIHDHSLPHRILGSTMTTTNETYPW
jgi:uracil-DNA glycosylase